MKKIRIALLIYVLSVSKVIAMVGNEVDSIRYPAFHSLRHKAKPFIDENKAYRYLLYTDSLEKIAGHNPYLLSVVEQMRGEAFVVLDRYAEAYTSLLKARRYFAAHRNWYFLGLNNRELARLKIRREQPLESIAYYKKSIACFEKAGDRRQMYFMMGNMGIAYAQMRQLDKAMGIFREVERLALKDRDSVGLSPCYVNMGKVFLIRSEFANARICFRKATAYCDPADVLLKGNILGNMSSLEKSTGNLMESVRYDLLALECYAQSGGIGGRLNCLERLSDTYVQLHELEKANDCLREHIRWSKELYNREKEELTSEMEVRFKLGEKQRALQLISLEKDNETGWKLLYMTFLGLALSILFLFVVKRRKERVIHRQEKELMQRSLEMEQWQKDQLQHELDAKARALVKEGLQLIQKNEQMEQLRNDLDDLAKQIPADVRKNYERVKSTINYAFSLDNTWNEFSVHFEQVHPSFLKKLMEAEPTLTGKEKRLCALIRVNMGTKEMASVLGISPDSVKTARHRLRKKLKLAPDADLDAFIQLL